MDPGDRRPSARQRDRDGDARHRGEHRQVAGAAVVWSELQAMSAVVATVFVSSLAGSIHCLAMCGPLVGMHGGAQSVRLALVHALGRLVTYTTLGALAGVVGGAVNLAGRAAQLQHVATIVAGVAIVAWGMHAIAVARGWLRGPV